MMYPCHIKGIVTQGESLQVRYTVGVVVGDKEVPLYVYVDAKGKLLSIEPVEIQDEAYTYKADIRAAVWWHVSTTWRRTHKRRA